MAKKRKNLLEVVPELFEHEEFGQFRYIKRGEEIWFVAVDVCRVLGYTNSRKALADHVPDKFKADVTIRYTSSNGVEQNRRVTFINEPGLYRLIMRSNLPTAEKFMDWVCEEVLPSIRKTGSYSVATEKTIKQKQLTEPDRRLEEYKLLQARAPYMTDEEILEWADNPDIIIYKVNGGRWQVGFC